MRAFIQLGDRGAEKRPEDLVVLFCLLHACFLSCICIVSFSLIARVHNRFRPIGVNVALLS